jgi:hypothetical protein
MNKHDLGRATRGGLTLAALVASSLGANGVSAQQESKSASSGIEEVVVTATRRGNAAGRPVGDAISADSLVQRGVYSLADLRPARFRRRVHAVLFDARYWRSRSVVSPWGIRPMVPWDGVPVISTAYFGRAQGLG